MVLVCVDRATAILIRAVCYSQLRLKIEGKKSKREKKDLLIRTFFPQA